MRKIVSFALGVMILLLYVPLRGQDSKSTSGPPKMLQLTIEDVKPGRGPAHEKNEASWAALFSSRKIPAYGIAMTAMSGKSEAWFVNDMQSWKHWDEMGKTIFSNAALMSASDKAAAVDGDLINNSRSYVLTYDPELSYRPDFNVGEMRFCMVDVVRVKPGHGKEYSEIRKAVNAAHDKANLDEHMLVYHADMGAPGGTYYIFEPIKDLGGLDALFKAHEEGSAYRQALSEDFQKMSHEFALNGLMYSETNMFVVNPKMSYVSDDVAKAAPDFWRPKAVVAKAKKEAGPATPAAQKQEKK